MNENAGPKWAWITAWSAQGAGLVLVEQLALPTLAGRIAVSGALAAIPLLCLYCWLSRR